jgi:hypothetical protein
VHRGTLRVVGAVYSLDTGKSSGVRKARRKRWRGSRHGAGRFNA